MHDELTKVINLSYYMLMGWGTFDPQWRDVSNYNINGNGKKIRQDYKLCTMPRAYKGMILQTIQGY